MAAYFFVGRWLESPKPVSYDTREMAALFAELAQLFKHSQLEFWQRFGLISLFALVTWLISVPIMVVAIYYPLRPVLRKFVARRHARAQRLVAQHNAATAGH